MKRFLLDTNVLVFSLVLNCPENKEARDAIDAVFEAGNSLAICPQVIHETYSILTRQYQVQPKTTSDWISEVMNLDTIDFLEPGLPETRLAVEMAAARGVTGPRFFDICLATVVIGFELNGILTDNTRDFDGLGVNIVAMRPEEPLGR